MWSRGAALAAVIALAGCPRGGDECVTDLDCGGGLVCANTHDCVGPGEVKRLVIRWTVLGFPASDTTCAPIPSLEVSVYDDDTADYANYAPVPCATGQFTFDKLPIGMDRMRLLVLATGEMHEAAVPAGDGDLSFDLESGSVPPPDAALPDAAIDAAMEIPDAGVDAP